MNSYLKAVLATAVLALAVGMLLFIRSRSRAQKLPPRASDSAHPEAGGEEPAVFEPSPEVTAAFPAAQEEFRYDVWHPVDAPPSDIVDQTRDMGVSLAPTASAPIGQVVQSVQNHRARGFPEMIVSLRELLALTENNPHIKGVTLDMFATLVQWTNSLEERHTLMWGGAGRLLRRRGMAVTEHEFRTVRDLNWYPYKLRAGAEGLEVRGSEILALTVRELARRHGLALSTSAIGAIAEELEALFVRVDLETLVVLPEARDVLQALKAKGLKIGLISNYPYRADAIRNILQNARLLPFFDAVLVSSAVGYAKSEADPHSTIFRNACQLLGVAPGEVLHVGDDASTDYRAPRRYGMNAIVCINREWGLLSLRVARARGSSRSRDWDEIESCKRQAQDKLTSYCKRQCGLTANETTAAANRLYVISRDMVAPVLIGFSEDNLAHLEHSPDSVNLCLGRDGLTSFLVQRKLIELFPERYGLIDPRDVRYISVSRQLVMQSSDALLKAYLHRSGVSQYQSISVIDFALSGSIQNRLHVLYPEKNISGRYLLVHRLWGDAFASRKTGFLVQTDGGTFRGPSGALHITGGKVGASLTQVFLGSDFVHFFEAIWNGIYESTTHLIDGAGIVRVANGGAKIFATPGSASEIAGIADGSIYLAFKKIALRGIVDGVVVYRKRQQLGLIDSTENAIHRLAEWFVRFKWYDGLDRRVVKALAPAFFNAPIALDSGGTPDDVSGALSDYQILDALMYGYVRHPEPRLANYGYSI